MAIEDSLAKLQGVVDEVVAEVKQAVSDIVGSRPASTEATPPSGSAPEAPAASEAPAEPAAPEGANVSQQDIVAPPTTEPPTEAATDAAGQ